jgi:hypothetical protein
MPLSSRRYGPRRKSSESGAPTAVEALPRSVIAALAAAGWRIGLRAEPFQPNNDELKGNYLALPDFGNQIPTSAPLARGFANTALL